MGATIPPQAAAPSKELLQREQERGDKPGWA